MGKSDSRRIEPEPRDVTSRRVLERAYRTWWPELCRTIERQFGAGPPDPEEAVQAAFERFAKLENPAAVENPRAYLHMSSRNYVLDFKRRAAVRLAARDTIDVIENSGTPAELDSEHVLMMREELEIVHRAVETMEPRRREVLIMHSLHGVPFSEIAKRMEISETRVRQLMASALAICAAAAQGDESGEA